MSSNAEKKKPTGDFRQDSNFLMGYFSQTETGLQYRYDAERLCIEAWGENALRVRATKEPQMPQEDWALSQPVPVSHPVIQIHQYSAEITNGKITAEINHIGQITFRNDKGTVLLREYLRNRRDMFSDTTSSLEVEAREFKPLIGGDYKLTMRFVGNREEKIFGMGQYQQNFLDLPWGMASSGTTRQSARSTSTGTSIPGKRSRPKSWTTGSLRMRARQRSRSGMRPSPGPFR